MKKKILLTGASGFIGSSLKRKLLERGYAVLKTTHHRALQSEDTLYWDLNQDEFPRDALQGLEGVIHLAGENIAGWRWTPRKKDRILTTRVRGTWLLAQALVSIKTPPRFFFSASAVGYYGNRGDEILTEKSGPGSGFLSEVCTQWEKASDVLQKKGVRVIYGRLGNVLDPSGGLLRKILPLFRWGLGAQMGNGRQWMSWISREDLMRAILWILFSHPLEGAVNCTAPHPVTQHAWAHFVAQAVHRPLLFKIPPLLIPLIFGQMGEELFLFSTRVQPQKLLESGFQFNHPTLSCLDLSNPGK